MRRKRHTQETNQYQLHNEEQDNGTTHINYVTFIIYISKSTFLAKERENGGLGANPPPLALRGLVPHGSR